MPTLPMSVETRPVHVEASWEAKVGISSSLARGKKASGVGQLTRVDHDHGDLVLFRVFLVDMNPHKIDGRLGRSVGGHGEGNRCGQRPSESAGDDKLLLRLGRFKEERVEGLEQEERTEGVGLPVSLHVPVIGLEDGFRGLGDT